MKPLLQEQPDLGLACLQRCRKEYMKEGVKENKFIDQQYFAKKYVCLYCLIHRSVLNVAEPPPPLFQLYLGSPFC